MNDYGIRSPLIQGSITVRAYNPARTSGYGSICFPKTLYCMGSNSQNDVNDLLDADSNTIVFQTIYYQVTQFVPLNQISVTLERSNINSARGTIIASNPAGGCDCSSANKCSNPPGCTGPANCSSCSQTSGCEFCKSHAQTVAISISNIPRIHTEDEFWINVGTDNVSHGLEWLTGNFKVFTKNAEPASEPAPLPEPEPIPEPTPLPTEPVVTSPVAVAPPPIIQPYPYPIPPTVINQPFTSTPATPPGYPFPFLFPYFPLPQSFYDFINKPLSPSEDIAPSTGPVFQEGPAGPPKQPPAEAQPEPLPTIVVPAREPSFFGLLPIVPDTRDEIQPIVSTISDFFGQLFGGWF